MDLPELDILACVPAALHRAVERFAERDYLIMAEQRLTFRQAEQRSAHLALELVRRGVGKGTRVGVQFSYGPEWVVAFFAAARIGALVVPLSTSYRPAELRKVCRHGDLQVLITAPKLNGRDHQDAVAEAFELPAHASAAGIVNPGVPHLRQVLMTTSNGATSTTMTSSVAPWAADVTERFTTEGPPDEASASLLAALEAAVTPADDLCVIYTSGTTGDPKGVVVGHGAYVRHIVNLSAFASQDESSKQFAGLPWFWVGGLVLSIGPALIRGFGLVCQERFDEAEALELIVRERPTLVAMWPQLRQKFFQYVASTGRDVSDVPCLAGHPSGVRDPQLFHASMGQTETLGPHTAAGPEAGVVLDERHRGSFGLPVPHVEHRIVDPLSGQDLPPGEEGEILVRGYSVCNGLYKVERHEVFDDQGWIHTGDLGCFRDGYLFFFGRRNALIKTLGSNVSPREVEAVLDQVPAVGLSVVVGIEDADDGEVVGAVVVARPAATIDLESVHAHARANLSGYKVPRRYLALPFADLPTLASGKPDIRELRRRLTVEGVAP